MGKWHRWFAWHPVLIDDRIAWLRTVERRLDTVSNVGGIFAFPMYREAPSPETDPPHASTGE